MALSPPAARHSGKVYASLGTSWEKNIVIEYRYPERKPDRERTLATELVRLKVDVIVTGGGELPVPPRKQLLRFQLSWHRIAILWQTVRRQSGAAGGNITGLSSLAPEISGKQLELLKESIPRLSRVAVFGTSTSPGNAQSLKETELAAGAFKVKLQYLDVLSPKDIETAFRAASNGRADAVLVLPGSVFTSQRPQITELAVKSRLPAIYYATHIRPRRGLMTYGPSLPTCTGALLLTWTRF